MNKFNLSSFEENLKEKHKNSGHLSCNKGYITVLETLWYGKDITRIKFTVFTDYDVQLAFDHIWSVAGEALDDGDEAFEIDWSSDYMTYGAIDNALTAIARSKFKRYHKENDDFI